MAGFCEHNVVCSGSVKNKDCLQLVDTLPFHGLEDSLMWMSIYNCLCSCRPTFTSHCTTLCVCVCVCVGGGIIQLSLIFC
jgi:hypothetical protein